VVHEPLFGPLGDVAYVVLKPFGVARSTTLPEDELRLVTEDSASLLALP
jgi:hypothetical protein